MLLHSFKVLIHIVIEWLVGDVVDRRHSTVLVVGYVAIINQGIVSRLLDKLLLLDGVGRIHKLLSLKL